MKTLNQFKRFPLAAFLLVILVATVQIGYARQESAPTAESLKLGRELSIVVTPQRDLRVDVWTDKTTYFTGENVNIYYHANKDAYIYIFNIDTSGRTTMIFPSYYDRDNFSRAGRVYSIPDRNYSLMVSGPAGREYIRVIAVRERHPWLLGFEKFRSDEPFRGIPEGFDGFRRGLESAPLQEQAPPSGRPGQERIIVAPNPPPAPPAIREFAESYTSFYVRDRWHSGSNTIVPFGHSRSIRFRSVPDDADLYVDGIYYGKTSRKVVLSYGPHRVRIRRRGYQDWVRSVFVDRNTDDRITAQLVPSRSPHWEPYRREWDMDYSESAIKGRSIEDQKRWEADKPKTPPSPTPRPATEDSGARRR